MTTTPAKTGYAPVDGLNMYYEVQGSPSREGLVQRAEWLLSMITEFLDAPMPEAG